MLSGDLRIFGKVAIFILDLSIFEKVAISLIVLSSEKLDCFMVKISHVFMICSNTV